jgi:hypothetical protein
MALSIGVSAGDKVFVGDSIVTVRATLSTPKTDIIEVSVDDGPVVQLTELSTEELLPEVRAFVGRSPRQSRGAYRIAFKAPRRILINRRPGEQGERLPGHEASRRLNETLP